MIGSAPAPDAHVVHVGVHEQTKSRFVEDARSRGLSVFSLDLSGIKERGELADLLSRTFMFPYETRSLDAAIDLISDLEWFGNPEGYLLEVDGIDPPSVAAETLAGMLPNIVDRWRSQGPAFAVVVAGTDPDDRFGQALAAANLAMDREGRLPWAQPGTGAVSVVNHG